MKHSTLSLPILLTLVTSKFIMIVVAKQNYNLNKEFSNEVMSTVKLTSHECVENKTYIWCLPHGYDNWKEPWRQEDVTSASFPWVYEFKFRILDIKEVDDLKQKISIKSQFQVSWFESRLEINADAKEWNDTKLGSINEVNVPPDVLSALWKPDLEVYGMEDFETNGLLKSMSSVKINTTGFVKYEALANFIFSCHMNFTNYPLETHECQFRIGSYYSTKETVSCVSKFEYDTDLQRSLQYLIQIDELPEVYHTYRDTEIFNSKTYAVCGFNVSLKRTRIQTFFQMYFISILFVAVSWVSFLIKPDRVPGRMGVLVTIFLVLVNLFNGFKHNAPVSKSLNAMDVYMLGCISLVFLALVEYAIIMILEHPENSLPIKNCSSQLSPAKRNEKINKATKTKKKYLCWNEIDSLSLLVFPILFVLFNISYCAIYLQSLLLFKFYSKLIVYQYQLCY